MITYHNETDDLDENGPEAHHDNNDNENEDGRTYL